METLTKWDTDEYISKPIFSQKLTFLKALLEGDGLLKITDNSYITNCDGFYNTAIQEANLLKCNYIGSNAFQFCSSLSSVNLPLCNYIGKSGFASCTTLQSIDLPLCSHIGDSAFDFCISLQSASLPSCNYIENWGFVWCSSLKLINLPQCSYMGQGAFGACISLSLANLPLCNYLGFGAFAGCSSLQSVTILASSVCYLTESRVFASTPMQDSSYLGYFGSIYVPSSLVSAYKSATNWALYSDRIMAYQG